MSLKLVDRNGTWYVSGTVTTLDGRKVSVRKSTGYTKKEKVYAGVRMAEIVKEVMVGAYERKTGGETVSEAIRVYLAKGHGRSTHEFMARFEDAFGRLRLRDLNAKEVNDWVRKPGLKQNTMRRNMAIVLAMLNYAREYGMAVPELKLKRVPEGPSRIRWLEADERDRFIEEMGKGGPEWRALTVFLFFTGARIGEALALDWKDVEHDAVVLWTRKGTGVRRARRVPLHDDLRKAMGAKGVGKVFGMKYTDVYHRWMKACRVLGIEDFTVHDARHTFATLLCKGGEVDIQELQDLLGHTNIQMTLRYKHLIPSRKREVVMKMPGISTKSAHGKAA